MYVVPSMPNIYINKAVKKYILRDCWQPPIVEFVLSSVAWNAGYYNHLLDIIFTNQLFLLRKIISYPEIISVSNFPIESKIQIFHRPFSHRFLKSKVTFKTTYPNNYFTFQSFHWFHSRSRCRPWNLFHVISYAPDEVVTEKRKGRRSGSSFIIDFSIFYCDLSQLPFASILHLWEWQEVIKKKAADEIEIIPTRIQNPTRTSAEIWMGVLEKWEKIVNLPCV